MTSKIKVDTIENVSGSGNVSLGSGHNLVVPGTVSVTGASTLTGGVTSSAAHTVTTTTHANASVFKSTGNTQIMLQDTDASANDQFWGLQNSGGDFNILTCNDDRASGFVTPMTITQAGYILNSTLPAFHVYSPNNTNSSGGISSAGTLTWGGTHVNQGSHFNASNGKFTAPVAGTYYFSASLLYDDSYNNVGSAYWRRNGSGYVNGAFGYVDGAATGYEQVSFDCIIGLAANDTMELYSTIAGWHIGGESSILGYLLG